MSPSRISVCLGRHPGKSDLLDLLFFILLCYERCCLFLPWRWRLLQCPISDVFSRAWQGGGRRGGRGGPDITEGARTVERAAGSVEPRRRRQSPVLRFCERTHPGGRRDHSCLAGGLQAGMNQQPLDFLGAPEPAA